MSLLWLYFGEGGCFAAALALLFMFRKDRKVYIVRRHILNLKICTNIDLLCGRRTQIQKGKNMLDMIIIILPVIWASFACYFLWFATSAKRNVPITLDDAKTLWKIHRKTTKCTCHKWRPLSRKSGKISGFECECGYKYTQRRPLLSGSPRNSRRGHGSQAPFSVTSY